ncbi:site-specific DNA-methyltransferase [Natranaerobius thermophilus]|uniref:DNA methylase N-4/N-6 domain protein n=1 Tax=Natranaerobius thermophilus (strain ATCC BAA-1301 / DSM 18059 / JW/NM-WN-LF) TaxID=457570 RepID=B2A5C7_NATTJ|nr:site-specific DNA-methyltransferase [Natranaerobius thermophilus]ACB83961.1 DNA methylase N-4/N-6 domain protein [Natranaerobius thermophilus JW/NM-WN-LF]
MKKFNGESKDIVAENISKLKELFPEVESEGKIDFERLQEILGEYIEDKEEKYRFEWNGKSKAIKLSQTPSTGTLRPCKEESKNWDETENLFIEGDNLEVLKLLQKTYHSSIKMIYIDPPYNTGGDFVYEDDFQDNLNNYLKITGQINEEGKKNSTNTENGGRFHTKWLNMMYPRLKLARNLLNDQGVIFISIDDNESGNLWKVCNEIFGETNFVAEITVIVKTEGRRYGFFAKSHEKIYVYAKNIDNLALNEIDIKGKKFTYRDEFGGFNIKELRNQNTRAFNSSNRPNLRYPFYVNTDNVDENGFMEVSVDYQEGWEEVYPMITNGLKSVWRWGKESARQQENKNLVARRGRDGIIRIYQKYRKLTEIPKTVWKDKEIISIKGTKEVQELLGSGIFDFPKPVKLLSDIITIATDQDSIILDFFSGAATTAHATIKKNAEDGGTRKYIMVQLPEKSDEKSEAYKAGYKNISEIGKERIRRAGEKILDENKDKEGIENLDTGFKVFKLDSSNLKEWNPDYDNLEMTLEDMVENFVDGRTEEDVVYEIMLKYGIDLTFPIETTEIDGKKVYNIGFGALFVCLDDEITLNVVKSIAKLKEDIDPEITRVVFKDNGFQSDAAKTNAIEILKRHGIEEIMSI